VTQHPLRFFATLLLPAAVLAGCNQEQKQPQAGPVEALPPQSFRRDWAASLNLKNDHIERVFAREDMVIAYTKNQMAFVINRGSGLIRFIAKMTDSPVRPHAPVVLKERIVFPTSSTLELYRRDGRFERSFTMENSIRTHASGEPNGSRLFVGVDHPGSGRLVCIETAPSAYHPVRQVWDLMADRGSPISAGPAVVQGICYAAFEDGKVYAVNAESRSSIWATSTGPQYRTFGPIEADLRADDFGVYVASTDTKLYCLNRNDGKEKWIYHARATLRQPPDVTASTVYLPVTGQGVVAIDKQTGPKNGQPRWTYNDAVKMLAEDEKFTYLQRKDNTIAAVDKNTGQPAFQNQRKDLVAFATNTKGDGLIYAATKDGQVLAIAPVLKPGFMGELAQSSWTPVADSTETLALK
jgi:hypothetical protein